MQRETVDIFISGGGIAGLVAAAAFGDAGFSVLLVDPAPPPTESGGPKRRPALHRLPATRPRSLRTDRPLGHAGPARHPARCAAHRRHRGLAARDPRNPHLRRHRHRRRPVRLEPAQLADAGAGAELHRATAQHPLAPGHRLSSMLTRTPRGHRHPDRRPPDPRQTGDRRRRPRLAGARGRRDRRAKQPATGKRRWPSRVTHPLPHGNVSTEIYNQGGAFTTVPLPDHQGSPASAIVWMNPGARALELAHDGRPQPSTPR